jgi:hypothetical protein
MTAGIVRVSGRIQERFPVGVGLEAAFFALSAARIAVTGPQKGS